MAIDDILIRNVDVIEPEQSAQVAAGRMHTHNIGCLLVVDEHRQPVGMLTDRDLAVRVVAPARDAATTTVREVMTKPVASVAHNASLETALAAMRAGPYRRLAVVNASGQLAGLITLDDILGHLSAEFGLVRLLLRKESPASLVPG
ncbi:MAG: CBS domain-containing protein [Planctomycetia bacterium]|nr:CBS domain-containing protein [Planctomycetia bacterium]